jgi:uncharacterized phage protein (TIGR02218 family)
MWSMPTSSPASGDAAAIELFQVNYNDTSMGRINVRRGYLGEIRTQGSRFVAELRGMMQLLQQQIGRIYTPGCNADLFDARCALSAAAFVSSATVTAVSSDRLFTATGLSAAPTGYFTGGLLTWTGELNIGLEMEVKAFTSGAGTLQLFLGMPYAVEVGDAFQVLPGCDKSITTCRLKFNNVVNFRGFPHIPGPDAAWPW